MLLLHGGNTGFSMSVSTVVTGNNFAMISEHIESRWTLSMTYFTTINHVAADDSFVLQQDFALAHHACNTVKLLERELSTSLLSIIDLPLAAQQRTPLV